MKLTDRVVLQVALETGLSYKTVLRYFGQDGGHVALDTARLVEQALIDLSATDLRREHVPRRMGRPAGKGAATLRMAHVLAQRPDIAASRPLTAATLLAEAARCSWSWAYRYLAGLRAPRGDIPPRRP